MRTIGLDVAIQAAHKAVVADECGQFLTPLLTLHTSPQELDQLFARARDGAPDAALQVVMEPTGMAWFPIAAYCLRQGVIVYLVNGQEVADLRRYYRRHAKSDHIDARVLVRLPLVNPEQLHRLILPPASTLACQRSCRQLDRLSRQLTAIQNRLQAIDRFAWPGLEAQVFADPNGRAVRWFRAHWYDPCAVVTAGAAGLRQHWLETGGAPGDTGDWIDRLVHLAQQIVQLYGQEGQFLDFAELHAEVRREQGELERLEQQHQRLRQETVQPLYRQIHPSRNLETIKGIGPDGAAVYASFIGDPRRFHSSRAFRGWSGLVPGSSQSADSEAKGVHITQAGSSVIKKFAYLNAEVARQWDPQLAAIYYEQIVHKGKHHTQAVCACATHLLDRVRAVLSADQPYELRDVDGRAVSVAEARAIVLERYQVPTEVRRRTTRRQRQQRKARQAEQAYERESRLSKVRGEEDLPQAAARFPLRSV